MRETTTRLFEKGLNIMEERLHSLLDFDIVFAAPHVDGVIHNWLDHPRHDLLDRDKGLTKEV